MEIITGGVTAAKGFMAAGVEAGIKYQNRKDMAMVYSKTPCRAAGVFTTNVVKAAPVLWDKEVVESEWEAQAIVVNSGIANACTGKLAASDGKNDRRCAYAGKGDQARRRSRNRCGKGDYDNGYPQQAGCSKGDDWWKRSNHRRHVQRLRHDSSEYVHNARICDNGCEYLQKASAGSTER